MLKGGQLLANKKSMENRKCHFLLSEIFISTILQIRQEWVMVQKSFISTFFGLFIWEKDIYYWNWKKN
jgi:hypothetical protein